MCYFESCAVPMSWVSIDEIGTKEEELTTSSSWKLEKLP